MENDENVPLIAGRKSKKVVLSYFLTLLNCLFSASFTVFSLYTVLFEQELGYTPLNVNYVSIAAEMGLYLCVPFLGYIADATYLSYLGIIGSFTAAIGYSACAYVVKTKSSYLWMALSFAIVGISCSAVFISCLVHCARLFPKSALLAISMPTTVYGLSSLLYAHFVSSALDNGTSLISLFFGLSILLTLIGLSQALAPYIGVIGQRATVQETVIEEENNIKKFFTDKRTLACLLSFVFVSGPLEMFQNNIGLINKTNNMQTSTAKQVALFSGFSTFSRLSVGALADGLKFRPPMILLVVLFLLALTDTLLSFQLIPLGVASAFSGFGYGSSFTLYPVMVARVWGLERFATYWGLFILGPALGSFVFGVLFALDIQWEGDYILALLSCAVAFLLSIHILYSLKFHRIDMDR